MNLNYVNLLREVGPHFSVNRMLTAECYKQRMERGLSFLRVQLHDHAELRFLHAIPEIRLQHAVWRRRSVEQHVGGTELIRRKLGKTHAR